jgi:hypothetical protein
LVVGGHRICFYQTCSAGFAKRVSFSWHGQKNERGLGSSSYNLNRFFLFGAADAAFTVVVAFSACHRRIDLQGHENAQRHHNFFVTVGDR